MQVDPIKPKLKPPGTKHLKLQCDILVSTSAFKFNLRRCITGSRGAQHVAAAAAAAQAQVGEFIENKHSTDVETTN